MAIVNKPAEAQFGKGKEKLIAASSGAMVTTITMNPFDVVKTRLQTQSSAEPLFVPSKNLPPSLYRTDASTSKVTLQSISAANQATCCQPTYFTTNRNTNSLLCRFDPRITVAKLPARGQAAPFSTAAAEAAFCSFPNPHSAAHALPALTAPASRRFTGPLDVLAHIIRHEGVGTLWRGVGPAMAISVPSQATYMVGYDILRRKLLYNPLPVFVDRSGRVSEIHKLGAPLIAGALVRASIVTTLSPIELLRTRLQFLPTSSSFSSVWTSMRDVMRKQGVVSLWQGLPATLWRDVPFSGIYWASYEVMQRFMTGSGFGETKVHNDRNAGTFATAFCSGAASGSIAAAFTNPFDVIKTRRQVSATASQQSTFAIMREIATKEGVRGWMRGLSPRLAKVAPACGLMISFYEIGLAWTASNLESLEMVD